MKPGTWGKAVGGGLILVALWGAVHYWSNQNMNDEVKVPDQVDMWLGQSKADLEKNKDLPIEEDIQPAGATFRGFNYSSRSPKFPAVRFLHGKNTIVIPDVRGVDTFEDSQMDSSAPKGAQSISISLKSLTYGGTHQQARDYTYALLAKFRAAGWQRCIYRSSARLKGASAWRSSFDVMNASHNKNNYEVLIEDNLRIKYKMPKVDNMPDSNLDPAYIIPVEDMRDAIGAPGITWELYANHVYATVRLSNPRLDIDNWDFNTYMVQVEFETEYSYMNYVRKEASDEDAKNWRTKLWPSKLIEEKEYRAKREALARKYGLEIDEDYQDPIIFPVDPLGNESRATSGAISKVGALCPTTGMWYCQGVTTEQGIYMRKGDPMPGQSYKIEQREAMEWRLVKPVENT